MATKKDDKKNEAAYGDQSIIMLKGPDRVRKRPAVIFGSDGLEGCEHSVLRDTLERGRRGEARALATIIKVTAYR